MGFNLVRASENHVHVRKSCTDWLIKTVTNARYKRNEQSMFWRRLFMLCHRALALPAEGDVCGQCLN